MSAALLPLPDLRTVAGVGVAGNFAGHLEQAGESADFARVDAVADAPKGIFPWYLPPGPSPQARAPQIPEFLRIFPLAHDEIRLPPGDHSKLQIEPEVGLLARIEYDRHTGLPARVAPRAIGAFNDCSIRRPGAQKISDKKNWGPASKGLAAELIAVDSLAPDGPTASWRLACFLRRDGRAEPYGIDSRLPDYSYYGATLLDWIADRLAHQTGSDDTPLEPVGAYLRAAGQPSHALIGIGATRYTPLGETTFLQPGDESIVIVYDAATHTPGALQRTVELAREDELRDASVLRQRVVSAGA
ncbi:MAG: DUF5718 family protein [Patulibacter sp.]